MLVFNHMSYLYDLTESQRNLPASIRWVIEERSWENASSIISGHIHFFWFRNWGLITLCSCVEGKVKKADVLSSQLICTHTRLPHEAVVWQGVAVSNRTANEYRHKPSASCPEFTAVFPLISGLQSVLQPSGMHESSLLFFSLLALHPSRNFL